MEDKRYAVLIDSDNISSKYITSILDEMTKYGVVTYKRIYGDWTSTQANKWKKELMENSITPIQQFRNTVGKNATDSTLIIDAMDILYTESVDGFCIVSSDGDFTRLASRLRESGMHVIGMGENKTPRSFRAACTVFTDLELLLDQSVDDANSKNVGKSKLKKKAENVISQKTIENDIIEIITENDNKGRETGLGEIGSRLQKKYSDFDVRNYGYSSLSTFIDETAGFDIKKKDSTVFVALHTDKDMKKRVKKFAVDTVAEAGTKGIEMGQLGQKIHDEFPKFNVKEFGYATLSKFIYGIKDLKVETTGNNKKIVYIR
ncbi:TIGR00288 family protein [Lachnospiraceae bacterium]|nr:TIGR00288 family protein [Lachnospiraceae bacterium]